MQSYYSFGTKRMVVYHEDGELAVLEYGTQDNRMLLQAFMDTYYEE